MWATTCAIEFSARGYTSFHRVRKRYPFSERKRDPAWPPSTRRVRVPCRCPHYNGSMLSVSFPLFIPFALRFCPPSPAMYSKSTHSCSVFFTPIYTHTDASQSVFVFAQCCCSRCVAFSLSVPCFSLAVRSYIYLIRFFSSSFRIHALRIRLSLFLVSVRFLFHSLSLPVSASLFRSCPLIAPFIRK